MICIRLERFFDLPVFIFFNQAELFEAALREWDKSVFAKSTFQRARLCMCAASFAASRRATRTFPVMGKATGGK